MNAQDWILMPWGTEKVRKLIKHLEDKKIIEDNDKKEKIKSIISKIDDTSRAIKIIEDEIKHITNKTKTYHSDVEDVLYEDRAALIERKKRLEKRLNNMRK